MKETIKTIALSALIAAMVGFVAGAHYERGNSNRIEAATKTVSQTATPAPLK